MLSDYARHAGRSSEMDAAMLEKAGSLASEVSAPHTCWVSQSGTGLGKFSKVPDKPERKKRHS